MHTLNVSDLRTFIAAKDFAVSKAFYAALGWRVKEIDERLALLELTDHRFYLQDYYVKEWAENSMLHITVTDAQAWYAHVSSVLRARAYASARAAPPKEEPYGALVTYVWDPSGVLLHFAQWTGVRQSS